MRIYSDCYELMSETGRNLYEMGLINKPKTYQNKNIEGKDEFITKELICEQYCLTKMPDPEWLFVFRDDPKRARQWADAEFQERISGDPNMNPGEAWKILPEVWEEFFHGGMADYTYCGRMSLHNTTGGKYHNMTKLESIIQLLKDDSDTRKAILDIYGAGFEEDGPVYDYERIDGEYRIPCSMYYDFLIRDNVYGEKQLNITYHQRSSDFGLHFGADVYLAWKLMEYVAEEVGVKPGYLYHSIDSLHAYKRDWIKLKSCLANQLKG